MRGSDLGRILARDGRSGSVEVRVDRSVGSVCVPRSSFEERGVAHRFARDDELDPVLEIVGRADGSVTIREADLSRIP